HDTRREERGTQPLHHRPAAAPAAALLRGTRLHPGGLTLMNATIVLLPGDGIGPEIVEEARKTLEAVAAASGHHFTFDEHLFGGAAIDAHGTALTEETLAACKAADAVLLGA